MEFAGYRVTKDGKIFGLRGRMKTHVLNGYERVGLTSGGVQKFYSVHRVIFEAFNGTIPSGMQINHKNGIKTDNRLSNLELSTPSENGKHAYLLGLSKRLYGESARNVKLNSNQAKKIVVLKNRGVRVKDICFNLGVTKTQVADVWRGKCWSHVTGRAP